MIKEKSLQEYINKMKLFIILLDNYLIKKIYRYLFMTNFKITLDIQYIKD